MDPKLSNLFLADPLARLSEDLSKTLGSGFSVDEGKMVAHGWYCQEVAQSGSNYWVLPFFAFLGIGKK